MSVLRLFENETDPGAAGGDVGGGAVADPVDAGDQGAPADEWSAPSREDWETTQSTLTELQERLEFQQQYLPQAAFQQQQPQYQQPQAPAPPEPWSDNYAAELAAYVQYHAQQAVQPYEHAAATWQEREGEARAQDMIHDDVTKNGDYIVPEASTDKVKTLADAYFNASATQLQQQGVTDPQRLAQAATQAFETAIGEVRAYEKQIGDAAVERFKNELAGLDPRRQQLPASGDAPAQGFPAPGGGDEIALARRYTSGQGLPR